MSLDREAPRRAEQRPRRHRLLRRLLIGAVVLVALLAAGLVVVYRQLESNITALDLEDKLGARPSRVTVAGPRQPLNVLVMGDDNRLGGNGRIGGDTPGLSDTTILLHLSADRDFAYGVSLPRDAMVDRPTCVTKDGETDPGGLTQFNRAYAVGGPACTIRTVEHLTGIPVDHFVVVDFEGFQDMVDALGGVPVCLPHAVDDDIGHIHMPAGTYEVTGRQALDYVRERHAFGDGSDIGRMKRQQTFIASMVNKAVSAGTLANPVRLYNFLDAATKSLTTDPDFAHLDQLVSLGRSLRGIGLDRVKFITVPWRPYPDDPNRIEWAPRADRLWERVEHDEPLGPAFDRGVVSAANPPGSPRPDPTPDGDPSADPSASPGTQTAPERREAEAEAYGLCS